MSGRLSMEESILWINTLFSRVFPFVSLFSCMFFHFIHNENWLFIKKKKKKKNKDLN